MSLMPDEPLASQRRILDAYEALAPDGRRPLDFVMSTAMSCAIEYHGSVDDDAVTRLAAGLERELAPR